MLYMVVWYGANLGALKICMIGKHSEFINLTHQFSICYVY